MTFEQIIFDARSVVTVLSFLTFMGIVWWTYGMHRRTDFDAAANLPFADEPMNDTVGERHV